MPRPPAAEQVAAWSARAFRRSRPFQFGPLVCTRGAGIEFIPAHEVVAEMAAGGPEPEPLFALSGPEQVAAWVAEAFEYMERSAASVPRNRQERRALLRGRMVSEDLVEPRDDSGPPGHAVAISPHRPTGPPVCVAAPQRVLPVLHAA